MMFKTPLDKVVDNEAEHRSSANPVPPFASQIRQMENRRRNLSAKLKRTRGKYKNSRINR
jgi:hypothetical protein